MSSFLVISQSVLLAFLILGIFLISLFWQRKKFVVAGFCIIFLALGIWRYQLAEIESTKHEIRNDETTSLIGIVASEPDIRERSQRLVIRTDEKDKVLITTWRYPEYQYGDRLKVTGKLQKPPVFEEFNYRDYLKKDGIYSQMSWPEIELLGRGQGNFLYATILQFKNKLRESLYQNLSPPESSILGAMILGDKRQLSEELKNDLNIAGVRHITAVSGLHVTILSTILMTILIGFGLWRQQAFWFSIILITLFVIMTGLQPSAVRAGIMGGLFLLAQYWGRQAVSLIAIVFAASVMVLQNPLLLRLDIGFQLSFLAILGIIYLLPIFQEWLKFIRWQNVRDVLAMTFSAYIFTLPLIIYNFGYASLVAPLANLLIVPILYPIMLLGFLFVLVGMIFQPLGWILSWPAWLLLTYLTTIVDLFSKLPFAYLTIKNFHWAWLLFAYLILGFVTYKLQQRQKLKFLQY